MTLRVTLEDGQVADLVEVDGERAVLRSPRAFAPGAPLRVALTSPPPSAVEAKSLGSKRTPEGDFVVKLRLINLTRKNREALIAQMNEATG